MKGLQIFKVNNGIHKSDNTNCSYELKATDSNFEVMLMTVKEGAFIVCQPYECDEAVNFYFIYEGMLENQSDRNILRSGDCFTVKNIETSIFFKVIVESKVLWMVGKNIYEELARENKTIVEILKNIQQKDHYTYDHCSRVGKLTRYLSIKMGLSDKRLVNSIIAAMCHDIGKIDIPIEILNKPGKLTDEEFNVIKSHAKDGYQLVVKEFNENIAEIISQHHERINGEGYPLGISGDEILLEAKILAVADSYDAMISDRPYRASIDPIEALKELKRGIGTLYEAEVVSKFEEVLREQEII